MLKNQDTDIDLIKSVNLNTIIYGGKSQIFNFWSV